MISSRLTVILLHLTAGQHVVIYLMQLSTHPVSLMYGLAQFGHFRIEHPTWHLRLRAFRQLCALLRLLRSSASFLVRDVNMRGTYLCSSLAGVADIVSYGMHGGSRERLTPFLHARHDIFRHGPFSHLNSFSSGFSMTTAQGQKGQFSRPSIPASSSSLASLSR